MYVCYFLALKYESNSAIPIEIAIPKLINCINDMEENILNQSSNKLIFTEGDQMDGTHNILIWYHSSYCIKEFIDYVL